MSVRNVRAHQSRGLLPPPVHRGRAAYYGEEHVARLRRIRELQGRGFNLASIGALFRAERDGGDGAGLRRLLLAPLLRGDPVMTTVTELRQRFGVALSPDRRESATDHGLLRYDPDGRVEVASRQLLDAVLELVHLGLPALELMDLQLELMDTVRDVTVRFVTMCLRHAWGPFAEEGFPADRWEEVRATFLRLHRAATEVAAATYALGARQAAQHIIEEDAAVLPNEAAG